MTFSRIWIPLFWIAAGFALVVASLPHPPELPGNPNDKLQHVAAFVTLTILATAAYPSRRWWQIALGLSGFGILIELIQMIPALHRDADVADWAADTVAVLGTLAIVALARWFSQRR